jgi:Bacterial conjugation TrbI-like protein
VTRLNGHSDNGNAGLIEDIGEPGVLENSSIPQLPVPLPEAATRAKQRAKQQIQQNRFIIIAAGAVVTALLIFVAVSRPHRTAVRGGKGQAGTRDASTAETSNETEEKSLFPITDSGRPAAKEAQQGFLNERDLQRTVVRTGSSTSQTAQPHGTGTLSSIQPFGDKWQAPPPEANPSDDATDVSKSEREAMEKPSLMYVRKTPAGPVGPQTANYSAPELGLGLATGARLRAHLDSAASTAVHAPVLAVIEYNYEQGGEIIVPAGAKAVGRIREANRSGYVDLEFDSLLMPDGVSIPIAAAATGLDLRPLKGKVEGKNTGKNVLVRSLSGIGQAGSLFLGQGSLNEPLSESDLMRERVATNIGETGDQEISRLSVSQQIVVTVSAGIPIYVVLQQTPKADQPSPVANPRNTQTSNSPNAEQLRQLLQLQQELTPATASSPSAQ